MKIAAPQPVPRRLTVSLEAPSAHSVCHGIPTTITAIAEFTRELLRHQDLWQAEARLVEVDLQLHELLRTVGDVNPEPALDLPAIYHFVGVDLGPGRHDDVVIWDPHESDERDRGAIFAELKTRLVEHLLAHPGRAAFIVDEAVTVTEDELGAHTGRLGPPRPPPPPRGARAHPARHRLA